MEITQANINESYHMVQDQINKINTKISPATISPRLIVYGFGFLTIRFTFVARWISEIRTFGKITWPHTLNNNNI